MVDTQGGVFPRGQKVNELTEDTALTIDLGKYTSQIFALTCSAACAITFINAPIGYSEITILLTDGGTDFDVVGVQWVGGASVFTSSGLDLLVLGIHCTAVDSAGAITGVLHEVSRALALADD